MFESSSLTLASRPVPAFRCLAVPLQELASSEADCLSCRYSYSTEFYNLKARGFVVVVALLLQRGGAGGGVVAVVISVVAVVVVVAVVAAAVVVVVVVAVVLARVF